MIYFVKLLLLCTLADTGHTNRISPGDFLFPPSFFFPPSRRKMCSSLFPLGIFYFPLPFSFLPSRRKMCGSLNRQTCIMFAYISADTVFEVNFNKNWFYTMCYITVLYHNSQHYFYWHISLCHCLIRIYLNVHN